MEQLNEKEISTFLKDLLETASAVVSPGKVTLCTNENLPANVDVQTVMERSGDYTIHVKPEAINNEYEISHEILHICAKAKVPNFVRVIEPNIIGMIGIELQGYLEHNWILAEQQRRGLEVDELKLFSDIENRIGSDQEGLEPNIERILMINNLIHTFPKVFENYKSFFKDNNPKSLELSERIMAHFTPKELYSNYEARRSIVKAIKEWSSIFKENGLNLANLNLLLSVIPVFSEAQMQRMANVVIGLIPNAIINQENETASHVLYTLSDGQCCAAFSMDEKGLLALENYMSKMTLTEFLELTKIPYLIR